MLRTSEANLRLLMQAAVECGDTVNLPVDIVTDMAADLLDAHRKQKAVENLVARFERPETAGDAR